MLFNKKLDKKDKTKKGFTLVELLAVIVVITLISGVGIITYLKTINNSKSKATLLAINNIKEAAYLYSKEGTDEIEWVNSYGKDGKESGKYACVSVQQLINKGYFKDNFFDKEIYKNSKIKISKNTFIEVRMGTNNDNLKVVVNKNDNTEDKCIGSAINGNLFHLKLGNDSKSYTDTIKLNVSKKDTNKVVQKYTVSINDEKNSVEESFNGRNVTFGNLKNSTLYKIKACMTTEDNNYYCDSFDIFTKDFIKPTFTIDSGWKKEKTIRIKYSDTNILEENGSHYFTSEVGGEVRKGTVYSCDKENSTCNSTTTNEIVSDGYYKLGESNKEISFTTTDNIDKGVSKKLTAIIKDPANNSGENSGKVNKIDRVPPTCQILNAPSGWVGKNFELKSSCSDSGSGCFKNSYVAKVSTSNKQTITVSDKVGNTSTCSAYVMVDTTPPTCNVSVDGGVKGNQINNTNEYWYKEGTSSSNPVKVTIGCNDENGCEQDSISGGSFYTDDEHKYSKEIKDKFGNTTTCSGVIKIDATRPSAKIGHDADNYTLKDESTDSGGSKIASSNWWGAEVGSGGTRYLKVTDGAGNWDQTSISVYKYCSKTKIISDDVKAFKWNYDSRSCEGKKKYRKYKFNEVFCKCKVDQNKNKYYCGHDGYNDITKDTHDSWNRKGQYAFAEIYYKNDKKGNGTNACNNDGNKINSYVSKICTDGSSSKSGEGFHGYIWYSGAAGEYNQFGSGYYSNVRSDGKLINKKAMDVNSLNAACKTACSWKYNG